MRLAYSWNQMLVGSLAAYLVLALVRLAAITPDILLQAVLGVGFRVAGAATGDSPATRALGDLTQILREGGAAARIVRRMLRESRSEEWIGLVRGAVARRLS